MRLPPAEGAVRKIRQELTYRELYSDTDNIWSVLFTTGYLTQQGKSDDDIFNLVIPNQESEKDIYETDYGMVPGYI